MLERLARRELDLERGVDQRLCFAFTRLGDEDGALAPLDELLDQRAAELGQHLLGSRPQRARVLDPRGRREPDAVVALEVLDDEREPERLGGDIDVFGAPDEHVARRVDPGGDTGELHRFAVEIVEE